MKEVMKARKRVNEDGMLGWWWWTTCEIGAISIYLTCPTGKNLLARSHAVEVQTTNESQGGADHIEGADEG